MGLFEWLFGKKSKGRVKLLWSYKAGSAVNSVAIADEYVAAGSSDKNVYLFDYSGELLWSYKAGSAVNSVAIAD